MFHCEFDFEIDYEFEFRCEFDFEIDYELEFEFQFFTCMRSPKSPPPAVKFRWQMNGNRSSRGRLISNSYVLPTSPKYVLLHAATKENTNFKTSSSNQFFNNYGSVRSDQSRAVLG
ncbi:unnamed protein product [Nesidiocoris tenuis]|uniref:Uncharacterized protein n=1 Tax=Nesidiocoris tenuis TaxID=355587 RepID=A0A6H5H6T9_9HEMI|nr:unnamed protein product [Nesidiocoris tenuis]CAB0011199.1 unnamed protein product [Nesidiocoris tenuis]